MNKLGLLLAAFLIVAVQLRAEVIPTRLHLYIGGWDGPSYSISLTNGILIYKAGGGGYSDNFCSPTTQYLSPSSLQWADFRKTIDDLSIWDWNTNYTADLVLDGTQWRVDIAYSNTAITIDGSNAYPGSTNQEHGAVFGTLLKAIQALVNGNEFH